MFNLKKLLAGVLGAAMVMTSMTALADDTSGTTTSSKTTSTIDTSRTGSLTIHKYEYNGTGGIATGESTDTVPSDETALKDPDKTAQPLAGVTFTITKVAELTSYYGTNSASLPTVEEAKEMTAIPTQTVTTDSNGVAKAENLSLGLYLVQETSAPAQITGKVADFLVSIPMTDSEENEWLYDVHVFPKNSSTYAGVTLLKKGKVGDDTAAVLSGATFELQKKNSSTGKWETVTTDNKGNAIGTSGVLTTGNDGKISVSNLAPGEYRFVETGVPTNTGYIMDGASVYEFTIADGTTTMGKETADAEAKVLDAGTVIIDGVKVDTTQNPITVINYKPDVEKEVKDRTTGNWKNDSDYSADDTVPYRVKVDVPANVADLVNFTLTDTMEHQTYNTNSLKIYSDADLTNQILTSVTPTVSSDKMTWSIAFNSKDDNGTITSLLRDYAGRSIYIYFETILAEDAVVTSAGNPNTVTLEYSNEIIPDTDDGNPNEPDDDDDDDSKTPKKDVITDQATVYTFKIAVEKVDAADASKKLEGVKFDLYRKLADDATGEGVLIDPVTGLSGKYEKVGNELITDEKGEVSVNGLENGTYYLVETETNDGYNLLKAPVEVEIQASYTTETTTTIETDENGVTTTTTVVENKTFDNAGTNGVFTTTVKNSTGFTLPSTGGMGSIIFIVGGIALAMAGLLIILASNKKAAAK